MKKILLVIIYIILSVKIIFAAPYPEVSCSGLPSSSSCNQCFNGGFVYNGIGNSRLGIYDDFINNGTTKVYYLDENTTVYRFEVLQMGSSWTISNNLFNYGQSLPSGTSSAGRQYYYFNPNTTYNYLVSPSGYGLTFNFPGASTTRSQPASILRIYASYHEFSAGVVGPKLNHEECFYYYPAWCGDGTLDSSNGEQCDPNDNSHTGWGVGGCNLDCTINTTPPSCSRGTNFTAPTESNPIVDNTYPNMCPAGQTVGTPNITTSGNTRSATWTCNGISGGNCSADWTVTQSCSRGTNFTAPTESNPIVDNTYPNMCPAGQTVGTPNITTSGNTRSATWTCNGISGGNCSADWTVTQSCSRGTNFTAPTESNPIVDNTYPNMCPAGQTVGTPNITTSGNTRSATWTCNGISGGNCSADWTINTTITPACTNLSINGSNTTTSVTVGTNVSFVGLGTNLGSNPIYTLTLTDTSNGSVVSTMTGTTGSFNYTFGLTGNYLASLTIQISPTQIVGGSAGCARSFGVTQGGSSRYSCSTSNMCQSFNDESACTAASGTKGCYNTNSTCLANAPTECPPGGGSSRYSCSTSNICQSFNDESACTAASGTRGCYRSNSECLLHASTECSSGGSSSYYSCSTSSSCISYADRSACESASSGKGCYNSNSTCLVNAPTECPGGGGLSTKCGDGIVQRPNSTGFNETCDPSSNKLEWPTKYPWCGLDCLTTRTNPGEGPGKITITNPGELGSYFDLLDYRIIVGDGTPLFGLNDELRFESTENVYLGGKNYGINNNTNLIDGSSINRTFSLDVGLGRIDYFDHYVYNSSGVIIDAVYNTVNYPRSITLFRGPELQSFIGNTDSLGVSIYKDTRTDFIYPSQGTDNFYVNVQYFEEALPVRVSKNAVSGITGGNAYVYNPVGFDSNYIVSNFIDSLANGNFVNASANYSDKPGQNLSSLVPDLKTVGDSNLNDIIEKKSIYETTSINSFNTSLLLSSLGLTTEINNFTDFLILDKMGDNENILIKNSGDIHIKSNSDSLKLLNGVKTVIIEDGDLIIERDLEYFGDDQSWAFVIKNGDLIINKNVKKISGAFIVLNGEIKSFNNQSSEKQLIVEGNLIGDSEKLSNSRTYIRGTIADTTLTTGIIVNYSNRVLKNPPPMLTYFIDQYNQKKIAK